MTKVKQWSLCEQIGGGFHVGGGPVVRWCGVAGGSAGGTRAGDEGSRQLESTWPRQTLTWPGSFAAWRAENQTNQNSESSRGTTACTNSSHHPPTFNQWSNLAFPDVVFFSLSCAVKVWPFKIKSKNFKSLLSLSAGEAAEETFGWRLGSRLGTACHARPESSAKSSSSQT